MGFDEMGERWGNGITGWGSPVSAEHFHSCPTPPSSRLSPTRIQCQEETASQKAEGEGVGRKWALPLACLTVPDPLPCVTSRRTSLAALNLQSLSFEGWLRVYSGILALLSWKWG